MKVSGELHTSTTLPSEKQIHIPVSLGQDCGWSSELFWFGNGRSNPAHIESSTLLAELSCITGNVITSVHSY